MNNYINFTSDYNPNLQALSSVDGYNAVKMNEMFGQIMGNIAAVQSTLTGSFINVRSFAPGDGSDQTAQIKAFLTQHKKVMFYYLRQGTIKLSRRAGSIRLVEGLLSSKRCQAQYWRSPIRESESKEAIM